MVITRTSRIPASIKVGVGDNQTPRRDLVITGESSVLAPFTQVNGNTFFAYAAANGDGISHFLSIGTNLFGIEDIWGGGDRDYDDQVIGFRFQQGQSLPG